MAATPFVSCASPRKSPFARTIGSVAFDMAIVVGSVVGSPSLTVLLTKSNSGRNAYQAIASAMTPIPIIRLRLLIESSVDFVCFHIAKILLFRCPGEVERCRAAQPSILFIGGYSLLSERHLPAT